MIQANELRIGNWVLFSPTVKKKIIASRMVQVEEIRKDNCVTNDSGIPLVLFYNSESLQAASLTPEILEKCGFERLSHFTVQDVMDIDAGRGRVISIGCVGTPNEMIFINEEDGDLVNQVIVARNFDYDGKTYLHQLQNLYFALTGEELQIAL